MGPLWRDQFQVTAGWELAEEAALFIVVGQDTHCNPGASLVNDHECL